MRNKKKILVTGGVGAVGTYLVKELRSRGHEVFVADHKHTREPNYARCDVGEFRQVERLWTGGGWEQGSLSKPHKFDVVYHLAAEFGRWNGEDFYENALAHERGRHQEHHPHAGARRLQGRSTSRRPRSTATMTA